MSESIPPQSLSHKSKKSKLKHARQISTQRPDQFIRPSTIHDQNNLPEFLDVERFINSRSFEISAMERAMKSARESGSQRAFQSLPRHLRRRSASHFSRRLPSRLRFKSKFETLNDQKKTKSKSIKSKLKSKMYKNLNKTNVFRNRQIDKKWLTTHIWHSKRTKMIDLWGFRLAETPTEKCYRPTYRASKYGSTIHDLSYFFNVTLISEEESLIDLLQSISDPFGSDPSSIKYKPGQRECNLNIYEFEHYPNGYIGPISMIWCPNLNLIDENEEPPPGAQEVPKLNNRNPFKFKSNLQNHLEDEVFKKENLINLPSDPITIDLIPSLDLSSSLENLDHLKEPTFTSQDTKESNLLNTSLPSIQRKVLLQIHPSIKDQIIKSIHQANRNSKVIIESNEELGSLELFGPRSTEVLGRVLETDEKVEVMKLFKNGIRPNLFPLGMVIGLTIDDPRIHFPPRKINVVNQSIHDLKVIEPKVEFAKCKEFWNQENRKKKPKFKKSQLDKRREEQLIPGTRLKPLIEDDRIPILLIKIKLGWKLMISNQWIQSIFQSILFTNIRLVCLKQRSQILFENQISRFPDDFMSLKAFEEFNFMKCLDEKKVWDRKPSSKRICVKVFEKSELDYFFINWDLVFENEKDEEDEDLFIPTDHSKIIKNEKTPWLLNGLIILTFLNSLSEFIKLNKVELNLSFEELMENQMKLFEKICEQVNDKNLVKNEFKLEYSLVKFKLISLHHHHHDDLNLMENQNSKMKKFCRIYKFDFEFLNQQRKMKEIKNEIILKKLKLIGFLNEGNFSMKLGNPLGFGCLSFWEFIKIKSNDLLNENEEGLKMNEIKVIFRNRDEFDLKIGKLILIIDE